MTGTSVWIKKSVIPGECQSPAASRRKSAYESPRRSPRKQVKIGDKLPVPPLEGGNDEKSGSMTAITNELLISQEIQRSGEWEWKPACMDRLDDGLRITIEDGTNFSLPTSCLQDSVVIDDNEFFNGSVLSEILGNMFFLVS